MKKSISPGIVVLIVAIVIIIVGLIYFKFSSPANRASKYPEGDPSKMPPITMPAPSK